MLYAIGEEMNNYLQFDHQDGKIYFDKFRISELTTYPNEQGRTVINIDIKTYDGPYSDSEVDVLSSNIGKINNDMTYCWIELRDYETELDFNDLIKNTLEFEEGYNINNSEGDSIAHAYFGWSIELNHNRLEFEMGKAGLKLSWKASSSDVNYYDERAKGNNFELETILTVHHFKDFKSARNHELAKNESQDLYYSILRLMSGHGIPSDQKFDVSLIEKGNSEFESSYNAWSNMDKVKILPQVTEEQELEIKETKKKKRWWWQ